MAFGGKRMQHLVKIAPEPSSLSRREPIHAAEEDLQGTSRERGAGSGEREVKRAEGGHKQGAGRSEDGGQRTEVRGLLAGPPATTIPLPRLGGRTKAGSGGLTSEV